MKPNHKKNSFAVFPFLKTSGSVTIGKFTFQSTGTTDNISTENATCINEIASMLFLQDNLRIKNASFAVIPYIDLNLQSDIIENLMNIQSFVAYCYASPRHESGDLFLSSEHASMAIFSPGQVSIFLVRPDFHVDAVEPTSDLVANPYGVVDGYSGLYNFKHNFWVANGSRLYGPKPNLTLNISQDLSRDLNDMTESRNDYRLLNNLLSKPNTQAYSRFFNALGWFNAANNEANDTASSIVNLSMAFESLLCLPAFKKTEHFINSITLLLGKIPRLDVLAKQFYEARSQIVHEGHIHQSRFIATDSQKSSNGPLYQSLLSYGRRLFQLSLGTLLVGDKLAYIAGLAETLFTNQERFEKICQVLSNESLSPNECLIQIEPLISTIRQYQFVPESSLRLETLISAAHLASNKFLEYNKDISLELFERVKQFSNARSSKNHLEQLESLQSLSNIVSQKALWVKPICGQTVRDLLEVVWNYVSLHYFWLKQSLVK
jgi:hypothetical protein